MSYRRARKTLSEELGLEPGQQLQELERKILNQDPSSRRLAPPRARRDLRFCATRRRLAMFGLAGAVLLAAAAFGLVYAMGGSSSPLIATTNSLAVIDPAESPREVVPVGTTPRGVAAGRGSSGSQTAGDGTVTQIDQKLRMVETIGIAGQATDVVEACGGVWVVTGIDNSLVPDTRGPEGS